MLGTVPPNPRDKGNKDDISQGAANSVNGLIGYVMWLQEENSKDPTLDRFYNMPEYNDCKVSEEPSTGDLSLNFEFNKFGKLYKFNIVLPLFMNLPPRPLRKDAVDYYIEEAVQEKRSKSIDFNSIFIKTMYHPITKVIIGVLSVANLLSLIAPMVVIPIIPSAMLGASVAVKVLGVLSSMAYVAPILAYYYGNDFYRVKLEAFFSQVEEDINNRRIDIAYDKLQELPFVFRILLNRNFPDNRDLRRKYYNMLGRSSRMGYQIHDNYVRALEFTDNARDKLLPLRGIINDYECSLEGTIRRHFSDCLSGMMQRCENAVIDSEKWRAKYVAQIPTDAPLYHELGAKVRAQIQECIAILREERFSDAAKMFYNIEWDAYSRHAYPDAAIMYYQMEAIITFFSKKRVKPEPEDFKQDECLNFALEKAPMVQNIINKYYPEKSQKYEEIMNSYEKSRKEIFKAKEPKRECSVTELPEIFTPMALAAKKKQDESSKDKKDDPNSSPPRIPSPKL